METKSRYQVIMEMENAKMNLIKGKQKLTEEFEALHDKKKELYRDMEDCKEEIKRFEDSRADKEKIIDAQLKSIEESLKTFQTK